MLKLLISESSLYLKRELNGYINEVIEERNDFNYQVFDFEETPLDDILDSLQTPSFFGDDKVVILKNPYFIKDEKIKLPFTNDLEKLNKYLKDPNPTTSLIIICPKKYYNAKSKFITAFKKYGDVENLLFENEDDFREYANTLIKAAKLDITLNAKEILITRCIDDVCKLEREIAKLSSYDDYIDESIIDKLVSRPLEDNIFELSNALMERNSKKTLRIYNDLKLLKVEPIALIGLLANQYRLILQVAILKKKAKTEQQIADYLSVHPYRVKLASKYASQYRLSDVKQILVDLANLDNKIKLGISDRYVDFELFLASK